VGGKKRERKIIVRVLVIPFPPSPSTLSQQDEEEAAAFFRFFLSFSRPTHSQAIIFVRDHLHYYFYYFLSLSNERMFLSSGTGF
jgi:hypothetical protein